MLKRRDRVVRVGLRKLNELGDVYVGAWVLLRFANGRKDDSEADDGSENEKSEKNRNARCNDEGKFYIEGT